MTVINGVTDSQARARATRARRQLAQWQREDDERFAAVTYALAQSDAIPIHMKAIYAQTICSHSTPALQKGEIP
jgi:hypothetical protein